MSGTIFFKHVYFSSLNKIRNIFWGQKILGSTFHVPKFVKRFSTYLNIIRNKLVGQTDLRSKFLYLRIHEIFSTKTSIQAFLLIQINQKVSLGKHIDSKSNFWYLEFFRKNKKTRILWVFCLTSDVIYDLSNLFQTHNFSCKLVLFRVSYS